MRKKTRILCALLVLVLALGITIPVSAASSVKISKSSATLYVGQKATLSVNGTTENVTWSSSKESVATVNQEGKVTAKKAGTTTIKATVNGKTVSCKISVKKPYFTQNGKKVNSTNISRAAKNKSAVLTFNGPAIKSVKSNKNSVVSVSKKGKNIIVMGKAAGKATITVIAKTGRKYTFKVTVKQLATGLAMNKSSAEMVVGGGKLNLSVNVSPAKTSNKSVIWTTSDSKIATVSNGKVTAVAPGTVQITATAKDGSKKSATCTVTVKQPVTGIAIQSSKGEILVGENLKLKADVKPSNASNKTLQWTSNNTKIATVTQDGMVTGVAGGTAVITIKSKDGSNKSATKTIKVLQLTQKITISDAPKSIHVGETAKLTANVLPADTSNKNITWSSSNTDVATVDKNGVVTALLPGTVEITATAADGSGAYETCEITVGVATQAQLDTVLNRDTAIETLVICSDVEEAITIPEGSYTGTTLVVDTLAAELTNNANFNKIELKDNSGNTFTENARGNRIVVENIADKVIVSEEARASIDVVSDIPNTTRTVLPFMSRSANVRSPRFRLVNNGTVSQLTLQATAIVEITGAKTSTAIPVVTTAKAAGAQIETSQNLHLVLECIIDLILNEGAEETTAKVESEDNIPNVSGLGAVTVTNTQTNEVNTVVAENSNEDERVPVTVTGKVIKADGSDLCGATVYLVPYSRNLEENNVTNYIANASKSMETDENGAYQFADVTIGNYYLVAAADGYTSNVQTLVITSMFTNAGNYNCENIILVENTDGVGAIAGTISDALTGGAIDYSVKLVLRRGQNNLSSSILDSKVISAEENGVYTLTGLAVGTYTIQVLPDAAAEHYTKIMNTSFTVTVIADQTANGNFTITRTTEDDQVRFVLTWGDSASGAPADLDSHLVGPRADGAGVFHTYYVDKNYFYGDERYADLDVDDTEWEGPETTTIYQKSHGVYSFYVYDYSDQEDEFSSRMSNKSSAVVNVYEGSVLRATYYIPTGCEGNLWHVCDYDARTGVITSIDQVGYWPNEGSSTVGLSSVDIYRNELDGLIYTANRHLATLGDSNFKKQMSDAIATATQILNETDSEAELVQQIANIQDYIDKVQNAARIRMVTDINGEALDWDREYEKITITGTKETLGDIRIATSNEEDVVTIQDVESTEYVKMITVTNTALEITKTYYVYYQFDKGSLFMINDVTGDNITRYSQYRYTSYGELYVYGTAASLPQLTINVPDGVTYVQTTDEDGNSILQMESGSYSYYYNIYYGFDNNIFAIANVTGEGVTNYDADRYTSYGELYVYGTAASLPQLTLEVNDSVTYVQGQNEDGDNIITMTYGERTYVYYVYYSFDTSLVRISGISGTGVISTRIQSGSTNGTINMMGVNVDLTELEIELNNQDAAYAITAAEADDTYNAVITVTYGEVSYVYNVYYADLTDDRIVTDIQVGDSYEAAVTEQNPYCIYKFVPEESDCYQLISTNCEHDSYVEVYKETDGSLEQIAYNDDGASGMNFGVQIDCTANETYYFVTHNIDLYSDAYTVTLTKCEE